MCLHPDGPYPLLVAIGEQGSAKTTAIRVLKALVDPGTPDSRTLSSDPKEIRTIAKRDWLLFFDNLSRIDVATSDALCKLSTGGGFGSRGNYTDDEESIFSGKRPIALTSILDVVARPDLADRSVFVDFPNLGGRYESERQFWKRFQDALPRLLGALLDSVSAGLRREHEVRSYQGVRMADFMRFTQAASRTWGLNANFASSYMSNREFAKREAQDEPLARAVIRLMSERTEWQGTATELARALNDTDDLRLKDRSLKGQLRHVMPALRTSGLEMQATKSSAARLIRLFRKSVVNNVTSVTADSDSQVRNDDGDANDDVDTQTEEVFPCVL